MPDQLRPQTLRQINIDDEVPQNGLGLGEGERMRFAKQTLLGLAIFCLIVTVLAAIFPDNKQIEALVDLIKIGALPLVTLIVSFYFPQSRQ